jgi:hypothetical protein
LQDGLDSDCGSQGARHGDHTVRLFPFGGVLPFQIATAIRVTNVAGLNRHQQTLGSISSFHRCIQASRHERDEVHDQGQPKRAFVCFDSASCMAKSLLFSVIVLGILWAGERFGLVP